LELHQVKSGTVSLPGVRLRVRAGPDQTWEEVSWPEPLHEPRNVAPPVELPPLPPPLWPSVVRWGGVGLAALLGGALLVRTGLRWRASRRRPLPAHARALQQLEAPALPALDWPAERAAHLSSVL